MTTGVSKMPHTAQELSQSPGGHSGQAVNSSGHICLTIGPENAHGDTPTFLDEYLILYLTNPITGTHSRLNIG